MAADDGTLLRQTLEITFHDLPASATVRLDFAPEAGAELLIAASVPTIRLGASFGGGQMGIQSLSLTPRRLQFEVSGAPSRLPLIVSIHSAAPFVHGWLQVPGGVQTTIASAAERIRFVGPSYWVVPLIQAVRAEPPVSRPAAPPAAATSAPAKPSRPAAAAEPVPAATSSTRTSASAAAPPAPPAT